MGIVVFILGVLMTGLCIYLGISFLTVRKNNLNMSSIEVARFFGIIYLLGACAMCTLLYELFSQF